MFARIKSIAAGALLGCFCLSAQRAWADPPPFVLRAVPLREVSARYQEALVNALPTELVLETSNNWGHQAQVPSIQGVKLIQVMRNHGDWEKARVVTRKLPKHLWVAVSDLQALDDNRVAFTVHLVTPATVELDRQTWQNGIQIYSGHVRARFQLTGAVTMEATLSPVAKEETKKTRTASLRVARATFTCQDFVAENVNGVGGDLARLAGAQRRFQSWQPAMLREFQKPVLGAFQTASAASELRASLSLMVAQVLATRYEMLQARGAPRVPLAPAAAPPVVTAMPPPPVSLLGGLVIEIPLWLDKSHLPPPAAAVHREVTEASEHWGLDAHSIHYESSGHSGSTPNAEPAHKKSDGR